MNYAEEYKRKLVSAREAVMLVQDGDWVDYSQGCAFPEALDEALAQRRGELTDVKIRGAISAKPVQVVECDPEHRAFTYNVWHCSGLDRSYLDRGLAYFIPMLFRNNGAYYARGFCPVNVAMISVSPMDEEGNFGFGLTNCATREIISAAEHVILEVCDDMPRIRGLAGDKINISEADYVVEGHRSVCTVPAAGAPGEVDRRIAENIFPYLYDGINLQIGIGNMPNVLGAMIADSDLKDLGVHTEMFTDAYLRLWKSGKITNRRKTVDRGKAVFSVSMGSRELYRFMEETPDIYSAPMSYVNNPETVRQLDHFVSINGCIAADLYGQVCSETAGTRQISGTGGQLDFVTGAFAAEHGQSFLAMPSTVTDKKTGKVSSRILPRFTEGDVITTPRTQTHFIVTEYGVACLPGKTTWERAEQLVNIAHPDFREELIRAAEEQRIWRSSNKRG